MGYRTSSRGYDYPHEANLRVSGLPKLLERVSDLVLCFFQATADSSRGEFAPQRPDLVRGITLLDPGWHLSETFMTDIADTLSATECAKIREVGFAIIEGIPGFHPPNTPAWVIPWQRRRAWAVDGRVLLGTFEQMHTHLGPEGARYLEKRKTEGLPPRLVTLSIETCYRLEVDEVGVQKDFETIESIAGGHWFQIVESGPFPRDAEGMA